MIARPALCLGGALFACHPGLPSGGEPAPWVFADSPPEPGSVHASERQPPCTLADRPCPEILPKLGPTALPASGWTAAAEHVAAGILTVRWRAGEDAALTPSCRPPGRYHEVAADSSSPGHGWAADRIFFRPDEVEDCSDATHAVIALALRDQPPRGEMILAPLPCPPGMAASDRCIAAGESTEKRRQTAQLLQEKTYTFDVAHANSHSLKPDWVTLVIELAARVPDDLSAAERRDRALAPLRTGEYGGCSIVQEAQSRRDELSGESTQQSDSRLSHARQELSCLRQPSFVQCMQDTFVPGVGANCW